MSFSARKMHFFDKNDNIYPCSPLFTFDVKELFFPMVFFYLNSEGFVGGRWRWRRWWTRPLNIFNLAQNWPFLEDLKNKVVKSYRNHIHKVYVTQIHHDTWFWTQILMKIPQFLLKQWFLLFSKIHIFGCFSGVLEVKLKIKDKFYNIIDCKKFPSGEKEDEKRVSRKSYFHQIQPRHIV